MSQLVIGVAGAAVGSMFGMPGLGFAVGSMLGASLAPAQKVQGPRLDDLRVASSAYGTPIPYVVGHPRVAGQIVWASTKREVATTTDQGGKGGPSVESTTYTYEVDLLIMLSDNPIHGISRIWSNGKLIYNVLATASAETVQASVDDAPWSRLTFYGGEASQLPDPTYEAAVGVGNAPAYRGRGCVFIEALDLGASGQIPNLTFEIAQSGGADSGVVLNVPGTGSYEDTSSYARPHEVTQSGYGEVSVTESGITFFHPGSLPSGTGYVRWSGAVPARDIPGMAELSCEFSYTVPALACAFAGDPFLEIGIREFSGPTTRHWYVAVRATGTTYLSAAIDTASFMDAWHSIRANLEGSSHVPTLHVDGVEVVLTSNYSAGGTFDFFQVGTFEARDGASGYLYVRDIVSRVNAESGMSLVPPALSDVVSAICQRAKLTPSQFDVSELAATGDTVRAMAVGQVTSARTVLENLASTYFFDAVLSDKIYFRSRVRSPAVTIPFRDLGVSEAGESEPLPIRKASDLEIPAELALTYLDVDGDYQAATQYSDRLLSSQESTQAVQVPIGFTAAEAKAIADASLLDMAAGALRATVSLGMPYAKVEPADVVLLTGDDGSTYRMRVRRKQEAGGIVTLETVGDDSSVFTQSGLTSASTGAQTELALIGNTGLHLLDIPILRDADDMPGFYAAVYPETQAFAGCSLFESFDDVQFTFKTRISSSAVVGSCTTALPAWTGGNVFDETSSVTVSVAGELVSVTRDDILNSQAVNAALIGNEIVQYRTATLVSAGFYKLTGLLRGRRSTATTGHAIGDRFVALSADGVRFVRVDSGDLGKTRYYRAVSNGQRLSAAVSQPITLAGAGLETFAPVDLRADRATTDTVLTWIRSTRLSVRRVGSLAINSPLGEDSESYEVEICSDSGFGTVVRTLTSTTPTVTYTSAQQVADFGSNQSVLYVRVYQLSSVVGRGTPLEAAV